MAKINCPMCGEECFSNHLVKLDGIGKVCPECKSDYEARRQMDAEEERQAVQASLYEDPPS